MKKLMIITAITSLILGATAQASNNKTSQESLTIAAVKTAAKNDHWTQYKPMAYADSKSLYFKKKIKNKDFYTYRYQNRHKNKKMTIMVKVDYTKNPTKVEFVDKISMNAGRIGTDSKINKILNSFNKEITKELNTKI